MKVVLCLWVWLTSFNMPIFNYTHFPENDRDFVSFYSWMELHCVRIMFMHSLVFGHWGWFRRFPVWLALQWTSISMSLLETNSSASKHKVSLWMTLVKKSDKPGMVESAGNPSSLEAKVGGGITASLRPKTKPKQSKTKISKDSKYWWGPGERGILQHHCEKVS